jgi:hypothetical protein
MEKFELRTTKNQVQEFKDSILWLDIVKELKAWKRGFDLEMKSIVDDAAETNPSTASVLLHMGDLNGRIKAVDYVLGIPDMFLSILEEKKNDS